MWLSVVDDNTVWGCGWNKYGQLVDKSLPEKVFRMSKLCVPDNISKDIRNIVCGDWNTAFIT